MKNLACKLYKLFVIVSYLNFNGIDIHETRRSELYSNKNVRSEIKFLSPK